MKKKLSEVNLSYKEKIAVPDVLHFVWIGDLNLVNTDYINIWKNANCDKEICIWHHENSFLINMFHKAIHDYALKVDFKNMDEVEKTIKNEAFEYFFAKLKHGFSFDELIVSFLNEKCIPYPDTKLKLTTWFHESDIITRNIMPLFDHGFDDFFKYYCYEIILRGNLASASDIVRLLIIYKHGGIYVDVDTLPYTDHIFHRTNRYLKENNIGEDDFLLLSKTQAIINKIKALEIASNEMVSYSVFQKNKENKYKEIIELIETDISEFSSQQITPLGKIVVPKNILSLGSLKRLKGIYFNNVICSHEGSKAIRIILRVMRKRYIFLEKNNCIFEFNSSESNDVYLSRIRNWRSELIIKKFSITPVLTGPGLIVEVLLGLAYSIFELDASITPPFIAEYMQDECMGIAFYQHNLDTPDGMLSTWRN
ncbi:TcdA/TcdB catalytic glycosyltransferase domain-containing protein [Cedecea neteri]|uniref:TcdA/TcdB catalytic glycosyltransferase domain-containing protein n=1 Tax=Cedecea neteri TaxID=158822 RepID=UPI0004F678EA|nr:TcdA/TcdB catalytic glycosyltransferase domain-containing protein [Cedecea neteri]AIR66894.1 hypothetical protein LH86_17925 [Cedecea neteri]